LHRAPASGKSLLIVQPRLLCLVLALTTLLLYLPTWQHGFIVFDDDLYITENRMVQRGVTLAGIQWAFTTLHASNWHPVTWLSHMLDFQLFGWNAGAHHLVNVLFHVANTVLLFLLVWRTTASQWASAFVAALFAWHPLHVESVAWIAERKDVLCAFFGLLAIHAYVVYARDGNRRAYFASLLLFALGLMAKPMLVTWPFVFLLLDYWPLKRPRNFLRLALEKWPFFVLTAASCLITVIAQREEAMADLEHQPLRARLANAAVACATYLAKTVWPVDLVILYPLDRQIPLLHVVLSVSIVIALSLFAWCRRLTNPYLIIGWLWFLGMLVPVIGLVQVGRQAMADRYTYLPLIGLFLALALGGRDLAARLRLNAVARAAVPVMILLACIGATWRQLSYWQNSEALFAHAVAVTKENAVAHLNLGVALEENGKMQEALQHYRESLRINPTRAQAHNNVANLLAALGQRDEALMHYQQALRLDKKAPLAHLNLGTTLVELGRFDEAMQHYHEAARLAPDDPRPPYLMGKARLQQKQSPEAVAHFRAALRLAPNDFRVLTWLARVLASEQDAAVRNGTEAIALAERANELTGGVDPFVLDTLAMACAEAGRFADAQRFAEQAIAIAAKAGADKDVAALQRKLEGYKSGQPYRE
jgi:tetratricopeptide (TPR) repeat protein